jgi:hypothetical protein
MELVYVIKAMNLNNEIGRWAICENNLEEAASPEEKEANMLKMALTLVDKLTAAGWKITSQEVGMLHDDRVGYDFMNYFGDFTPPLTMNIVNKKLYPDE